MDKALKFTKLFARAPPTPEDGPKLVSIAFSHYCEKARWALDLSPWRDVYVEDAHMPVFHTPAVVAYTKDKAKTGTPLLVLAENGAEGGPPTILHDSTLILEHLSEVAFPQEMGHLYPTELKDQVQALVAEFDDKLGVMSRQVAYSEMSKARAAGVSTANPALFNGPTIPRVEGWLWRLMEGAILPKMLEFMAITDASAAQALDDCRGVFAKASAMLAEPGPDGKSPRRYLLGTQKMTAADLTFAALAYPLVGPPQFASLGFGGDHMSPWVARLQETLATEFRSTPAGQFALRLYAEERYVEKPYSELKLRVPDRNKWPWQSANNGAKL